MYKLLNAFDYEVPQKRERLFIIGIRIDLIGLVTQFSFPIKVDKHVLLKDVLTTELENSEHNNTDKEGMKYSEKMQNIMKLVPQGGCWTSLPLDIQREYMGKAFTSGGGRRGMARRLSMDEPCLTLTTSPCQKQTCRCHPIENRPLNVIEYMKIQTFDTNYKLSGGLIKKYKQIGNAVPVKLAYHVACSILKFLRST